LQKFLKEPQKSDGDNMFTGIVNGTGTIVTISGESVVRIGINFGLVSTENLEIGASVAVDGVCLTVVEQIEKIVYFDVIPETLSRTTLSKKSVGSKVNLERSLKLGDELGGHMLSGHIMGMGSIELVDSQPGNTDLKVSVNNQIIKYINPKGYVAVDGISLTIGDVSENSFMLHLIPETLRLTTIGDKQVGELVNIEIDSMTQTIVSTVERIMEATR
jgi:riboflavin synthase